jgi:Zn-dependent metalloprotease
MLDDIFTSCGISADAGQRHRHPMCCFLPPHILNSIITSKYSSDNQRARALDVLSINNSLSNARTGFDESQRAMRQQQRLQRLGAPRARLQAAVGGQPQRTVYTANHTQNLPGSPVRHEGDPPTGDPAVDEAYQYMGNTYDFYWNVFGRDSVDNAGYPLNGSVHYSRNYDNAFWDGQRMIYGDGDGEQFTRFTVSVDVIGHELTHGVTQYEAGLIYWKETGALNESISDVFGTMVRQYVNNQNVQQADWLIGKELFLPQWVSQNPKDLAIRSMKAPGTAYDDPVLGKDPQPSNMSNYQNTITDSGGVHINSGIANYAFYLAAAAMGGYSWQTVGPIWYAALQSPALTKTAKFADFARLTVQLAQQLYPGTPAMQAVGEAWAKVGIFV